MRKTGSEKWWWLFEAGCFILGIGLAPVILSGTIPEILTVIGGVMSLIGGLSMIIGMAMAPEPPYDDGF